MANTETLGQVGSLSASLTLILADGPEGSRWDGASEELIESFPHAERPGFTVLDEKGMSAVALQLEGETGYAGVYRRIDGALVVVEPDHLYFEENEDEYSDLPEALEAHFHTELVEKNRDTTPLGKLNLSSGVLVVADWNEDLSEYAAELDLEGDDVTELGDETGSMAIPVPPGAYDLRSFEAELPWGETVVGILIQPG